MVGKTHLKAQHDKAKEAVKAQHANADQGRDMMTSEEEDAVIEQELARIKEQRLKKIQALPSTVWT